MASQNVISIQSDEWGCAFYERKGAWHGNVKMDVEMHPQNLVDLANMLNAHGAMMELFCVMAFKTEGGEDIPFTRKYPEICGIINKRKREFVPNLHGWTHCIDTDLDKMNNVYFWREWDDLINRRSFSYEYQNERIQKAINEFYNAFGRRPTSFVSGGYCHTRTTEQILSENDIHYVFTHYIPYGHTEYSKTPLDFYEPFSEDRSIRIKGQPSLFNPGIWWSNRIIDCIKYSMDMESGDEEYIKQKADEIADVILSEWEDGRMVAVNIHQYNFLYARGTKKYSFNGIIFLDILLGRLEKYVHNITYLSGYEYGKLEEENAQVTEEK